MCIKVYTKDSPEYQRLQIAAAIMTIKSPRRYKYYVGECYFDFGQNWMWTTIMTDSGEWGGFQINPGDQENIITTDNIEAAVDKWFDYEHCPDKAKH